MPMKSESIDYHFALKVGTLVDNRSVLGRATCPGVVLGMIRASRLDDLFIVFKPTNISTRYFKDHSFVTLHKACTKVAPGHMTDPNPRQRFALEAEPGCQPAR